MSNRTILKSGRGWFCATALLGAGACTHAWDTLEPTGGAGGQTATTTSTNGGGTGGSGGSGTQSTGSTTTTGSGGNTTSSSSTSSTSSSSSGTGGSTPTHCGGTDILSWDFSDFQPDVFDRDVGTDVVGGEGIITLPKDTSGYGYAAFYTPRRYDFRGDRLTLEVREIPDQNAGTWGGMMVRYDNGDSLFIEAWKGFLDCAWNRGGTETIAQKAPYDPVQHRYWQIREDQGTVHCETSADGSTWNELGSYSLATSLLGAPSAVAAFIYAGTPPMVAAPGEFHVDNLNGGGVATGHWCPAQSHTDEFTNLPSLPGPAWNQSYAYGTGSYDQAGDQLNFRFSDGSSGAGYGSSVSYDMTGQRVAIEVVAIPADPYPGIYFTAGNNDDYEMYWDVSQDEVLCQYDKAGVTHTISQDAVPALPFWVSLRESGGTTYCEIFENGAWKTYGSVTNVVDPTRVDVYFGVYSNSSQPAGDFVATLDKYNITPAP